VLGAWLSGLFAVVAVASHVVRVAVVLMILTTLVADFPTRVLDMALRIVSAPMPVNVVNIRLTATECFFPNCTLQRGQVHRMMSSFDSRALKHLDFLSSM
jgi:hypothetical protein